MKKPFDILSELGKFGVERKISLRDPGAKHAFTDHVSEAVDRALADPLLMHGQRAEAMFEALLVSLDEYELLKPEDNGRLFPLNRFAASDFRVVLKDGSQWLIEVKNVYEADPFSQRRKLMGRDYLERLSAYAKATGADLKLAVFWARWSLWTLISPDRLVDERGDLTLDMMTAVKVSELGQLGDMSIGTRSPLRLRLTADATRTSPIGPDGTVEVVFEGSKIYSEEREILDRVEREIAWIFMQYGEWDCPEPEAIVEGDRFLAYEFRWIPREPSDQGFDFIGRLSRMFARYYAEHTIEDSAIVQLHAPLRPGWFAPLIRRDHESDTLPLWRSTSRPNYASFTGPA